MNIDTLVKSITETKLRTQLAQLVAQWKQDDTNVEHLASLLCKWHGNTWFQSDDCSNKFHSDYLEFRDSIIQNIGGFSLNERLYFFGLFDVWDSGGEETQLRIRHKLHASS